MFLAIGFLLWLTLLAVVRTSEAQCKQTVTCACGNSGTTFKRTVSCQELEDNGDTCYDFINCETCQDEAKHCLTCPVGLAGALCKEEPRINNEERLLSDDAVDDDFLPRKKRQKPRINNEERLLSDDAVDDDFLPRKKRQISGRQCPRLQSPKPGSYQCSYADPKKMECTGTCSAGYTFNDGRNRITLQCNSGSWFPYSSFPPCKSTGECELEINRAGGYSCSTNSQGYYCDIKCSGETPVNDRFFCTAGRGWNPPLPYCVNRKGAPSAIRQCNCLNGGRCSPSSSVCRCPQGYEGKRCEKRKANQCGIELQGAGNYKCGTDSRGYYCNISCSGSYSSSGRYFCLSGGVWNPPLPHCAKKNRS